MTQEQKAKAYDEALEKARKYRDEEGFTEMEDLFPELAESEDERMINGLQGFLSAFGSDYFGTGGWQKFDDWLERQKEQKPVENGGKELLYVSNKSYNIGYRDGKREAESKQEWSEEDRLHYANVLEALEYVKGCKSDYDKIEAVKSDIAWLKLLRNRVGKDSLQPHWKPSEEQMKAFKGYIEDFQARAEAAVGGWNNFDVMIRLYEQLKAIKEDKK